MKKSQMDVCMTSNEEKITAALNNLARNLGSAVVDLNRDICEIVRVEFEQTWTPENIKWVQADGAAGTYERSDDVNSLDFKAMLKDLATHNGKLTRDGTFYWTFKNGITVGRKNRKLQEPKP